MNEHDVYGRADVAVLTAAEAAAWDRAARESSGIPERVLMENAGRSAAQIVDRLFPRGRVVAVVGSGNNGGDGLVLLRTLRAWGREVAYLAAGSRPPDPALTHGHEIPRLRSPSEYDDFGAALSTADIVVDALLGTGTTGAPYGPAATAIEALNSSGRPVVSLDLPSGIDATTGAVPGTAVRALTTITLGPPKLGLFFNPARSYCGRLLACEIGFPPLMAGDEIGGGASRSGRVSLDGGASRDGSAVHGGGAALITPTWARARLPVRPPAAHKGTAGRVLIVAGHTGMVGAALVAAHAALRAGAGYLWVASAPENRVPLQTALPEAIFIDRTDRSALLTVAANAHALLIGPGLGVDDDAHALLEALLAATPGKPILLDADALTLLARDEGAPRRAATGRALVITPHPGEMGRLTGLEVEEITAAPVRVAREYAERTGCVVLLKGQPSVVAAPGAPLLINTVGSSDLARAGMGDQLAGVITALLAARSAAAGTWSAGASSDPAAAQSDPAAEFPAAEPAAAEPSAASITVAREAAALGLFYAGRAADLAARGRALGPRDVSEWLDRAFASPGATTSPLGLPFITLDQPARW